MIAHVSIPSKNPRATAMILARLIDGEAFDFPVVPGAAIAVARNGSGVAVEVYPDGMAHHPGDGVVDPDAKVEGPAPMPWEDQIYMDGPQLKPSAFHFALASPLTDDQIMRVAQDAGLRSVKCERGGVFGLVEVWLEDTVLVVVLSPQETDRYRAFMTPAGCRAMFGPGESPAAVA